VSQLAAHDVVKTYGVTAALRGLSLTAQSGEVLGVAGPNGAGKSTLIRILAGEEPPNAGEITLDGQPWPLAARRETVAVVHQEPQLFPNLTVAENLMVRRRGGAWRPRMSSREREILSHLRLEPYADRPLDKCSLVVSQLTEIARALLQDARLFLFDEPNSALTDDESMMLFAEIDRLKRRGDLIILFVSHRLRELVKYCDRVAIVREGHCAAIVEGARLDEETLASELVVGHPASGTADAAAIDQDGGRQRSLVISSLTHERGDFQDVSVTLPGGAITALTGVEGSGAREFVRAVAGTEPALGDISMIGGGQIAGSGVTATSYVPADRRDALFPNFSVGANVVARLGRPDIVGIGGWLQPSRLYALAAKITTRFRVKAASSRSPIAGLSGGNQQKVAIASAMATRPRLLVVEEPTRGVDVGTKADIYQFLREYAADGNIVLMLCTEATEVFDAADQVYVMNRGHLSEPMAIESQPTAGELAAALASIAKTMDQRSLGVPLP
jgi:ABC-type sugar transport system ATPase subunit